MADFRKMFYAFAVVALLAGLTVPASAQMLLFSCNTSVSVAPIVCGAGEFTTTVTGGNATGIVLLNTNVASRLLAIPTRVRNLIFPYVISAEGFDTGIALAANDFALPLVVGRSKSHN